jgi:hypothetical protein
MIGLRQGETVWDNEGQKEVWTGAFRSCGSAKTQDPIPCRDKIRSDPIRSDPSCHNSSLLNQAALASVGGFAAASAGGSGATDAHSLSTNSRRKRPSCVKIELQ